MFLLKIRNRINKGDPDLYNIFIIWNRRKGDFDRFSVEKYESLIDIIKTNMLLSVCTCV